MSKIAFLGVGLMGSAFIELLIEHGDTVVIWNRTKEKAEALASRGAQIASTPEEAVASVDRVHLMLGNDDAVDEILAKVVEHVPPATPIIDHSTVLPERVTERALLLEAHAVPFIHAPVFSPPALVREKKAIMLASGHQAAYDRCSGALSAMADKVWWLGDRYDKAAAFKLFGNLFMVFVLTGIADLYALAKSLNISAPEAHELFAHFRPDATIDIRGKNMAMENFEPQFTLSMGRKDIGLMLESARLGGVELSTLPHIAEVFDRLIESGAGDLDIGAIAKAPKMVKSTANR